MKLMKLFTLRNIILIIVGWWLWKTIVSGWIDINYSLPFIGAGTIENYGDPHLHYSCWSGHGSGHCDSYTATQQCTQIAKGQCGDSSSKLNLCWMPAFLKCSASAEATNTPLSEANCHQYANSKCGGASGDCSECFSKSHQTCMAKQGLGANPQCN